MERAEEILAVIAARQGGISATEFLLRPREGREFLGKALSTCTGHAASLMLTAISNTLPTKQILHKWFPAEHNKATSELCGKPEEDETITHFALNGSKLQNATTAARDKVHRRLSKALENALAHSSDRWVLD